MWGGEGEKSDFPPLGKEKPRCVGGGGKRILCVIPVPVGQAAAAAAGGMRDDIPPPLLAPSPWREEAD